jgi:hypothetical protein
MASTTKSKLDRLIEQIDERIKQIEAQEPRPIYRIIIDSWWSEERIAAAYDEHWAKHPADRHGIAIQCTIVHAKDGRPECPPDRNCSTCVPGSTSYMRGSCPRLSAA